MLPYEHCSMEDVFPHNKTQIKQIKKENTAGGVFGIFCFSSHSSFSPVHIITASLQGHAAT